MKRKAQRKPHVRHRKIRLVFFRFGQDEGTFVEERAYAQWTKILSALHSAKTWGEFRRLLSPQEFRQLGNWVANDGEWIYRDGRVIIGLGHETYATFVRDFGEYMLGPDTPFDRDKVDGYSEAEYPPFPVRDQIRLLPRDFLERYGDRGSSMVSNSWWQFPVQAFEEMRVDLERRGFVVQKVDPYEFPDIPSRIK